MLGSRRTGLVPTEDDVILNSKQTTFMAIDLKKVDFFKVLYNDTELSTRMNKK